MISSYLSLFFLLMIAASGDPSVASSPSFSFMNITSNTTSPSPGTITSSPSLSTSSSLSINTSCYPCVFAVDQRGLQQIFWFSQTWSVTLDTEHVTVTSFNGSNLTAVSSTRTALGNISALDTNVDYVQSLMSTLNNEVGYYNRDPTLVRGTDGSVGTTSYSYGQPFAEVTAIVYWSSLPNPYCPLNMGYGPFVGTSTCQCMLNTWFPAFAAMNTGINSSVYNMDQTFYTPLASSIVNAGMAGAADDVDSLTPWDGEHFKSWLAEDMAFKSDFPRWEDCAFWNAAAGPPAVKLPVAALTATTSTTVYHAAPAVSPTPKPASRSSSLPKSTSHTNTTPSKTPVASSSPVIPVQSGGDTGGDSGGSDSSGNRNPGSQGEAGSSGGSNTSSSSGDEGNTGDTSHTEASGISGSTTGANYGETGSSGFGNGPQGGDDSGSITGNTYTTASSVATEFYNSGQSGASSGSNGNFGSQSGRESFLDDNGPGSQSGGGQRSTGSSGSSNSASGGESPKTNDLPSIAPFIVTVGTHTISGNVHGSTAAVVAGNTIIVGSSPSSAGGALVSIHPGASSIYVNGESYPLPTAQASHLSAMPIATIGSHILSAAPGATAVYYAGKTLAPGGAHATIDNTDIYVGASGLVIGGSSPVALPTAQAAHVSAIPIATLGSHILSASPGDTAVYYAGTTLAQGGTHATIDNTDVYVGASGLVIGGSSTVALPTIDSPQSSITPIAVVGSQTISAILGGSEVYYSGITLTPNGAHATIDDTDIYVGTSGLVIGGTSSVALPALDSLKFPAIPIATIGSQTISEIPGASEAYYAGITLTQNGAHVTIDNADVYIGASGLVIGDRSTVPFLTIHSHQLYATPIATIGSQAISAIPGASEAYYAGTTLTQNGAHVTIDNTDVYVGSSGLVVGGSSTINLPRLSPASITVYFPQVTGLQTFTLGGQILSADSTAVYAGKSTLAVGGPAVTISGTPISLGSSDIVIASKTYTIPSGELPSGTLPGASQTSDGLGAIILGAFGSHTSTPLPSGTSISNSSTSGAIVFQGAAAKPDQWESMVIVGALLVGSLLLFVNGLSLA